MKEICFFYRSFLLIALIVYPLHAVIENEGDHPRIGNFANDRIPSTYFGFGQLIIAKNDVLIYFDIGQQKGVPQESTVLSPSFVYGLTNRSSLYLSIAIVPEHDRNNNERAGINDILCQFEYAVYLKEVTESSTQATVVANVTAEDINTNGGGAGTPSFFLGATFSYTSIKWYAYTACGLSINSTSSDCTRNGNTLLYEGGIGYNLGNPKGTTVTLLLDLNGVYTTKNMVCHMPDNNSGGNILFCGPTLYVAYKRWEFYAGVQGVVAQHLNGVQSRQTYRTIFAGSCAFSW
jgi:hypothetical protein